MKKKILSAALALAMTLSLIPSAFAEGGTAYASTQAVEVDGKKIEFQMYALKDTNGNGTNYVKLRDVAHVLNGTPAQFSVGFDRTAGTISITTKSPYKDTGTEMTTPFSGDRAYQTGSGAVVIDGSPVSLEAIVLADDNGGGYTYFKLRDLGEALGFEVAWDRQRGVIVETGGSTQPDQPTTPPAGTVSYYKDYPNVPDFGIYAGTSLSEGMDRKNGYAYLYDASKVPSGTDIIDPYGRLLMEKGYQYVGMQEYSEGKFMNFSKGQEKVNFGGVTLDGVVYFVVEILQEAAPSTSDTSNGNGYYAKWPQVRDLGAFAGVKPINVSESGGMTAYEYNLADLLKAKPNFTDEYVNLIVKDGFSYSHSYDIRDGIKKVGKAMVFHKGKTSVVFKYDSSQNSGLGIVTISIGDDPF